jgi:integrase
MDVDIGEGLSQKELKTLVSGFLGSPIYPIVAPAAATGMRRDELLAFRWTDLDLDKKEVRIRCAVEQTN